MNKVRFENPAYHAPKTAQDTQVFADACRKRPGQWALYGAMTPQDGVIRMEAYVIRLGGYRKNGALYSSRMTAFAPAGSFEAQVITLGGEHRIYARYVDTRPGQGASDEPDGNGG